MKVSGEDEAAILPPVFLELKCLAARQAAIIEPLKAYALRLAYKKAPSVEGPISWSIDQKALATVKVEDRNSIR